MQPLLKLFLDICLLRRGPQDVPVAVSLLIVVLIASLIVDVAAILFRTSFPEALLVAVVVNAVLLVSVVLLLWLLGYAARVLQTLIAMWGCSVIVNVLQLPLILLVNLIPGQVGMLGFIALFFLIWNLTISMHILRHALSIATFPAAVLAIGYLMLNFFVVDLFLPQAS